ncbi:MAG: hypothetical protein R3F56_18905 [Planctomycetota bacterium]
MLAISELSAMAESLLRAEGVDFLSWPRFVDLTLRVPLDARRDGAVAANEAIEQVLKRVREVREHDRALVPGSVYCYFSESATAETSRPRGPREVFDGYSSTGRPSFVDFVTLAIERKDPALDDLLAGRDVILAYVTQGRVLRTAQLAEFGKASPVYHILGQVNAGLFPVLNADHKAAFSFQILRGTTLDGTPRLRLHVVGAVDVLDIADPTVPQMLHRFQRRLDEAALQLAGKAKNGDRTDEEEFVAPLLQDLVRQIVGRSRRLDRRTHHATQRAEEGQRPTPKASEDATNVKDGDLLFDDSQGTIVVVGPKHRVHVFTPDAKHVTSVVMSQANVSKRTTQGRWRQADPEERGEFRMHLRERLRRAEEAGAVEAADTDARPRAPGASEPPASGALPAAQPGVAEEAPETPPSNSVGPESHPAESSHPPEAHPPEIQSPETKPPESAGAPQPPEPEA